MGLFDTPQQKEEKAVMAEFHYLKRLKKSVEEKDFNRTRSLIKTLGRIERRLQRFHEKAKSEINKLRAQGIVFSKLDELEKQVDIFANNSLKELSLRTGKLPALFTSDIIVPGGPDWKEIRDHVNKLETNFQAWATLEKELIQEGLDIRKKLRGRPGPGQVLSPGQERLHELLLGIGEFKTYTIDQRRKLWNKWTYYTTQKVLINFKAPGVNLSGFDFINFVFNGETILEGSNFSGSQFNDAIIYSSNLRKVVFIRALLNGANFNGSNLSRANFEGATLYGVNLERTDLTGANFEDTIINNANLRKADIQNVQNLTKKQLHSAKNWEQAENIPRELL